MSRVIKVISPARLRRVKVVCMCAARPAVRTIVSGIIELSCFVGVLFFAASTSDSDVGVFLR